MGAGAGGPSCGPVPWEWTLGVPGEMQEGWGAGKGSAQPLSSGPSLHTLGPSPLRPCDTGGAALPSPQRRKLRGSV